MESTAPNRRQQIAALLKRYWGFDTFRPVQEQVILSVLAGRDTLALMPTGGGKSLTYQIPGLASEGVCIVVTPLIALMKDQVDRLRKLGIRALAIHSGLSARQIDIDLDNCVYGDVKFLYVAPERLASEAFRLRVQRMNVSLLAVDEAHCISQWGYDFRPSYLRIAELRERIPGVPVLALTASATPRVADDIMEKLRFAEPHLLRSDFSRPNLSYAVRHTDDKTNSSCGSSATSAVPASSMSAPAKEPNRSRLSCATKVSPQNIITAGWDTPSARCGRKPGFRGVPPSWSLPMPSGWGSTSPTSATWYIIRCATHSKATIRRPDVPDATGDAAMPYC